MEQITIGVAGLQTSRIGLWTWAIGGWMWGARRPEQFDPIDDILKRCIRDPVPPEFMAPPTTRP